MDKHPRLIGIAGKAQTGKDTIGDYLRTDHGFSNGSFASAIKHGAYAMTGINPTNMTGPEKEEIIPWLGVSMRHILQTLGTEWGRELIHPDIWLKIAQRSWDQYKRVEPNSVGVVMTDVRFENEAAWVRDTGGQIWHVSREGALNTKAHISEAGIKILEPDVQIFNEDTIESLHFAIDEVLKIYG